MKKSKGKIHSRTDKATRRGPVRQRPRSVLVDAVPNEMAGRVRRIMQANGIRCSMHGSRATGVSVAPEDAQRAREILQQDRLYWELWRRAQMLLCYSRVYAERLKSRLKKCWKRFVTAVAR